MAGPTRDPLTSRLHRRLLLTAVGAACLAVGILIAVDIPEGNGPAWAMAVAGCLAAGLWLLGRVALGWLRSGRGAAL
jgi:hypothetical protein